MNIAELDLSPMRIFVLSPSSPPEDTLEGELVHKWGGVLWQFGAPLEVADYPILKTTLVLDASAGQPLGDIVQNAGAVPVWSRRLANQVEELGGRLQTWSVEISTPAGPRDDFVAVNLLDLCFDAVDREKTDADWLEGGYFDRCRSLVLSPAAVQDLRVFRIVENSGPIFVSSDVAEALLEQGLTAAELLPLDQFVL